MKLYKVLIISLVLLLLGGCNTKKEVGLSDIISKFDGITNYEVSGNIEINRADKVIGFDFAVSYLSPSQYKVILTNVQSHNTQVLLKNAEGVFILTPALNKKMSFQSDWPTNSSHAYLYQSLISDIKADEDANMVENENGLLVKCACVHKNNPALISQEILFSKQTMMPKSVTVFNGDSTVKMKVTFGEFNTKKELSKADFDTDKVMASQSVNLGEGSVLERNFFSLEIEGYSTNILKQTDNNSVVKYTADNKEITVVQTRVEELEVACVTRYYEDSMFVDYMYGVLNANSLTLYDQDLEVVIYFDGLEIHEIYEIASALLDS